MCILLTTIIGVGPKQVSFNGKIYPGQATLRDMGITNGVMVQLVTLPMAGGVSGAVTSEAATPATTAATPEVSSK